ncbi:hypothetical protein IWQ62_003541 [Dispira parvispora]|uniref:Uncharacterized protein n=1 Tax=Dispira parvispora TaxID=1520584 RepID=A0A9W8E1J6_9FUNG|nr:hypothetical protein IWQ62_003541 [Dispira parvispora]
MRFTFISTVTVLAVATAVMGTHERFCNPLDVIYLKNITTGHYNAYKQEETYLKINPNSTAAPSVKLFNRMQIPYLQQLCKDFESKAEDCGPDMNEILLSNSSCNAIKKLWLPVIL